MSGERGTTLSEVLIVLALSALIASPIYVVLQSAFRTEQAQGRQLEIEAQLEQVTGRMEDDIRAGVPSEKRAGEPATELAIWNTDPKGDVSLVLWSIEDDLLRRQLYDMGTGRIVSDVVLLDGLAGEGRVFRYWDSSGAEIKPAADLVFRCAVRVTVDLQIRDGTVEAQRTIDVAHRTENVEAPSC